MSAQPQDRMFQEVSQPLRRQITSQMHQIAHAAVPAAAQLMRKNEHYICALGVREKGSSNNGYQKAVAGNAATALVCMHMDK